MRNKIFARMCAVLICSFIIISSLSPVYAKADGVFSESWFKEWEWLYNERGSFDAIDAALNPTASGGSTSTVEAFSGSTDFARQRERIEDVLINAQRNFVFSRGGKPSDSECALYPGLKEWYEVSQIFYVLGNGDTGISRNILDWGLNDDVYTIGIVVKVQQLANELNSVPVDSRPQKLKALSDYINSQTAILEPILQNPATTARAYADKVPALTGFLHNTEHTVYDYYDRGWLESVFTYDTTLSIEDNICKVAPYWFDEQDATVQANSDAVYYYILDRLYYLQEVRLFVNEQMARVPADYWNNVATVTEIGTVEENLSKLVRNVSDKVRTLLDGNTIRFENIIYGRVKTGVGNVGVSVNNFSFELEPNNMYGIAGAWIYSVLRGIFLIGILAFFMYYLAKESVTVSARERSKLKENIGFVILAIFLMFAMPNLVDLFIHLRDVILHAIAKQFNGSAFEAMGTLADNFKAQAQASRGLVDACEYMGMVIITVYLAFVYIGMACAMTIVFSFFPMFVIFSFRDHKILNEWVTFTLGVIATPLIDAVLFVIPLIASRINVASDLIKLILCMSIIPARGMIRRLLGFSSSTGAELVGLGAIMAGGRAIGALARTARNTVGTAAAGVSSVMSDRSNAKLHEELASADASAGASALSFGAEATDPSSPLAGTIGSMSGGAGGGAASRGVGGGTRGPVGGGGAASVYNRNIRSSNFEQNLGNISHDTAAKMYRQRARRTAAQTLFRTAGAVQGGLAGGALGLGASTFLGTNAAMMLTSGGAAMGSEIGGAAGHVTGTVGSALGEKAGGAIYSAYTHSKTGAYSSVIDAATSASYGSFNDADFTTNYDENGNPISESVAPFEYEGDTMYAPSDIRQGIIGDGAVATMQNIVDNDTAFSDAINNDFVRNINANDSVENIQNNLINYYDKLGEIAASCQTDDRFRSIDKAYAPSGTDIKTFDSMQNVIRMGAEARVDDNGKIILPTDTNKPANFDKLNYAFPKIHAGYNMPSYSDRDTGMSYSPKQGYIGRGMTDNMRNYVSKPNVKVPKNTNPNAPSPDDIYKPSYNTPSSDPDFISGLEDELDAAFGAY